MIRSFRLRIALLSGALAGSAIVGFGAVCWYQIYNAQISRLDAQLLNQLMRASRLPPGEQWQFYKDSLTTSFGTNTKIPIALLVKGVDGSVLYQSDEVISDAEINRLLERRLRNAPPPPPRPNRPPSRPVELPPRRRPPLPELVTEKTATEAWRITAVNFNHSGVAIGVSLQAVNQQMATIQNIFLVTIPVTLILITFAAWFISGRALYPIRELTGAIQQVTVQGLKRRVPFNTTDVEFIKLIEVFNQMLERLERSFLQASRFSADAAHELKTPLTILQGTLEQTLQQVETGSELQQRLGNLLDEVRRLSGIVRKLLLLSLADAGQMSLYLIDVDIYKLLMEIVEDIELLAPHLTIETYISNHKLQVKADRDLLVQVLQNLISNAIKYNLDNGWIKISTRQTQANLYITIANASNNIPLSDRTRIFDRFYRADPARTRKVEGIGLGLSLAREIMRAHHGALTLEETPDGETAFTLTLPIS